MKYISNIFSASKTMAASVCLLSISSAALSAVTFTELPTENWGGSIAVSNEGTVVFSGDYTLYRWNQASGLSQLKTVEWARVAGANISDDGRVIAFTSVGIENPMVNNASVVYQDGQERVIGQETLVASALLFAGKMSPDGKFLTGMIDSDPAYLDLENDTITVIDDIEGENLLSVSDMSYGGGQLFIKAQNGYTPDAYFKEGDSEPEYVDLIYSAAISANGQYILGEKGNCSEVQTLGANLCTAVWNKDSKEISEIGYFRPTSISRDGSIVTGNGWSDLPGAKVWDAYNGTREMKDVLLSNGVDVSGWSDFESLVVSSDGTKFAGYATNPQGIKKPFYVNVVPECIGF